MTAVLLSDTLDELSLAELRKFQWQLRQPEQGYEPLRRGQLENANIQDTVDLMVNKFREEAVDVTFDILRTMGKNQLAHELKDKHRGRGSTTTSASSSAPPPVVQKIFHDPNMLFFPQVLPGNKIGPGMTVYRRDQLPPEWAHTVKYDY